MKLFLQKHRNWKIYELFSLTFHGCSFCQCRIPLRQTPPFSQHPPPPSFFHRKRYAEKRMLHILRISGRKVDIVLFCIRLVSLRNTKYVVHGTEKWRERHLQNFKNGMVVQNLKFLYGNKHFVWCSSFSMISGNMVTY